MTADRVVASRVVLPLGPILLVGPILALGWILPSCLLRLLLRPILAFYLCPLGLLAPAIVWPARSARARHGTLGPSILLLTLRVRPFAAPLPAVSASLTLRRERRRRRKDTK